MEIGSANGYLDDKVRATSDDGYSITLAPQSHGRWLAHIVDPQGQPLEWRIWLNNLEKAKIKALVEIEGDPDADRELRQGY